MVKRKAGVLGKVGKALEGLRAVGIYQPSWKYFNSLITEHNWIDTDCTYLGRE